MRHSLPLSGSAHQQTLEPIVCDNRKTFVCSLTKVLKLYTNKNKTLKFSAPPKVSILGKPKSSHFTLTENSELALVCLVRNTLISKKFTTNFPFILFQGSGEPAPSLSWTRDGGPLPDGQARVQGDQLIFSAVTREHQGTYVCSGTTETGAGDRDSVTVSINCE